MGGWLLCMTTMAVGGRETASRISGFQVMELRAFIGFVLLLPLVFFAGGFGAMKTPKYQNSYISQQRSLCGTICLADCRNADPFGAGRVD